MSNVRVLFLLAIVLKSECFTSNFQYNKNHANQLRSILIINM